MIKKFGLNSYLQRLKEIILSSKEEFRYIGITDLRKVRKIKEELLEKLS